MTSEDCSKYQIVALNRRTPNPEWLLRLSVFLKYHKRRCNISPTFHILFIIWNIILVQAGLISPDDREMEKKLFRRPRNCKIYQQTTAKISTNDIAVFSTITFKYLYKFKINSLLFKQPSITSQPYIHSHSHCCFDKYQCPSSISLKLRSLIPFPVFLYQFT